LPGSRWSALCCWACCACWPNHRPAHLTWVHQALTAPSEGDQRRLSVLADWKAGTTETRR
jgi:hypothetical protein